MHQVTRFIRTYLIELILFILFFVIRSIYLTSLPAFNDEAIYLNWGWQAIHKPDNLYFSLFDGKQPLLMWLFGIVQPFFSDPLLAGRFLVLLFGFATAIGLYCLAKKYISRTAAYITVFFYTWVPFFVFFDRQALMETPLAAIGIWIGFFFLRLLEKQKTKDALIIGVLLGIGYFIKSSALSFFFCICIFSLVYLIKSKQNTKAKIIPHFCMLFLLFHIILIPLYLQPMFWESLPMNERYVLSVSEIIHLPIMTWVKNISNTFLFAFWYITPLLLIISVVGIVLTFVKKGNIRYLSWWFLLNLVIAIIFARSMTFRYIVLFLPLLCLFASYAIVHITQKRQYVRFSILAGSTLPAIYLTILLITAPLQYFSLLGKLTVHSQQEDYVSNWTAGYGVKEALDYVRAHGKGNIIYVAVRPDFGNPEDAVFMYLHNDRQKRFQPIYFDAGMIYPNVTDFNCVKSHRDFYFISRDYEQGHLNKWLKEVKRFYKPQKKTSIGVYTFNADCKGKTFFVG